MSFFATFRDSWATFLKVSMVKEGKVLEQKKLLQQLLETPEGIYRSCILIFSTSAPSAVYPSVHVWKENLHLFCFESSTTGLKWYNAWFGLSNIHIKFLRAPWQFNVDNFGILLTVDCQPYIWTSKTKFVNMSIIQPYSHFTGSIIIVMNCLPQIHGLCERAGSCAPPHKDLCLWENWEDGLPGGAFQNDHNDYDDAVDD